MAFNPLFPQAPFYGGGAARLNFGTFLPPGARVVYLRSTGASITDPPEIKQTNILQTLAQALLQCRANAGDVIYALPGHSENVTTTPTWVAGVKLIGVGQGSNTPTFRWTATTSQWAINVADVAIVGCRLRLEGAVVVKAILVTGSGFVLDNCDIETASGTSNYCALGIELSTGSARWTISNCRFRGVLATATTTIINIAGTLTDGGRFLDSDMVCPAHTTNGLITIGNASTGLLFANLRLYNTVAASTCTISNGAFASDGFFVNIQSADNNNGTAASQGIILGATSTIKCSLCLETNEAGKNAIISPAATT